MKPSMTLAELLNLLRRYKFNSKQVCGEVLLLPWLFKTYNNIIINATVATVFTFESAFIRAVHACIMHACESNVLKKTAA